MVPLVGFVGSSYSTSSHKPEVADMFVPIAGWEHRLLYINVPARRPDSY